MPHIFISYSRVDKAFTERFVTRLRRMFRNYKVWYDAELHGGDQWWDAILAQVEACDLFIYLLSNESVTSPYCQAEFAEAQRLQKRIITVQVRDRTKLTGNLGDIRYVDMKAGIDDAEPQAALVDAINHQITKLPKRRPKPLAPERTPRPPTTEEKPRSAADPDVDTPTLHLTDKGELALAKTPPKGNNRPTLLAGAAVILIVIVLGIVAFSNPNLFAPANTSTPTPTATEAAVAQAATNTLPPTETASPTLEPTTTPTPSITLSPIPTLSGTEIEKTVQAQMKGIQTEAAQTIAANLTATAAIATAYAQMTLYAQATHAANLTATATLWTSLPTPDTRLTAETRLTQTQAALIAQATQNAAASATGAMLDQTATATLWTDTPTPSATGKG
ncbi:MAG TPA: toll/interleukin-1 receptor domain-containing protein, partial [Phototrophicaceae bacterium]|nr:toll/interleukin-1 receptor domain-containing protein [Phototrophicaceae bacterium]